MRKIIVLLVISFLWACGSDNNLSSRAEPEFTIEDNTHIISLRMPPDDQRTQSQTPLQLRNAGNGVLTVKSITWIAKPDRLVAISARGENCTGDVCDGANDLEGNPLTEPICLSSTTTCAGTGFNAPFDIGAQIRNDIDFVITKGGQELDCPEAPADVPADIANDYCGSFEIVTNAINSNGIVVEGKATVYFLDPGASGEITITPEFIEFTGLQPGVAQTQTFSVQNSGVGDLVVDDAFVRDNSSWFTIEDQDGGSLGTTIASGESWTYTMTVTPPAEATEEELSFSTELSVESSAGNSSAGKVVISLSAGQGDSPSIALDTTTLKFDAQATQTVTVTNEGTATLLLSGFTISPAPARGFYTISIDGTDVTANFPQTSVGAGNSVELDITFTRPGGDTNPSVAMLELSHNDRNIGFTSQITLLGDEGDVPIGEVKPSSFTFLAADGNAESRQFVVRNVGTAALDITSVMWNFSVGSEAEFQIANGTGTVQPGGIQLVTINFTGANTATDNGLAILESNNGGAPIDLALSALDSSAVELPIPSITSTTVGNARAGFPATFNASNSTPAGGVPNSVWTLLARPATSTVWMSQTGENASFVPDVAGTYTIALTLNFQQREAQTTMDIVVE